jgi:hypothetical protein
MLRHILIRPATTTHGQIKESITIHSKNADALIALHPLPSPTPAPVMTLPCSATELLAHVTHR